MKNCFIIIPLLLFVKIAICQKDTVRNLNISPNWEFYVSDFTLEHFPLRKNFVDVEIVDQIADVMVYQQYVNDGERAIGASYSFPLPLNAYLYKFILLSGKDSIEAHCDTLTRVKYIESDFSKNEKIRLELFKPNLYQLFINDIKPKDTVTLILKYYTWLKAKDGIYEFRHPFVVLPKVNLDYNDFDNKNKWLPNPYLKNSNASPYLIDVNVNIKSTNSISAVSSPSHNLNTIFESANSCIVNIARKENLGGNREFILKYSVTKDFDSKVLYAEDSDYIYFMTDLALPNELMFDSISRKKISFLDGRGTHTLDNLKIMEQLVLLIRENINDKDYIRHFKYKNPFAFIDKWKFRRVSVSKNKVADLEKNNLKNYFFTNVEDGFEKIIEKKSYENEVIVLFFDEYSICKYSVERKLKEVGKNIKIVPIVIGYNSDQSLVQTFRQILNVEPIFVPNLESVESASIEILQEIRSFPLKNVEFRFNDNHNLLKNAENYYIRQGNNITVMGRTKQKFRDVITFSCKIDDKTFTKEYKLNSTQTQSSCAIKYLWEKGFENKLQYYPETEREEILSYKFERNRFRWNKALIIIDSLNRVQKNDTIIRQPIPLYNYNELNFSKEKLYYPPFIIKNMKFASHSDKYFASSIVTLNKLSRTWSRSYNYKLLISSHTNFEGSYKYKMKLSQKRANVIKDYLIKKTRLSPYFINTIGRGFSSPVATVWPSQEKIKNERIEIRLSRKNKQPYFFTEPNILKSYFIDDNIAFADSSTISKFEEIRQLLIFYNKLKICINSPEISKNANLIKNYLVVLGIEPERVSLKPSKILANECRLDLFYGTDR